MSTAASIARKMLSSIKTNRRLHLSPEEVQAWAQRGALEDVLKWQAEEALKDIREVDSGSGPAKTGGCGVSAGMNGQPMESAPRGVNRPAFGVIV
ncbi:MAG: hypothetical protein AAGA36_00435 [Pseudomonadota bacterium]